MHKRLFVILSVLAFLYHAAYSNNFDLVVALGGGDERKEKAVELYRSGEATAILFTGELKPQAIYEQWQVNGIVPEHVAKNTPDDFRVIRHEMEKAKLTSVEIVDSDYHLVESKLLAKRILPRHYRVAFVSVRKKTPFSRKLVIFLETIRRFFTVYR